MTAQLSIEGEAVNNDQVFDPGVLLARVGGDRQCMREVMVTLLEEQAVWLERARRSVAANDPAEMRVASHLISGTLSNFGAQRITAVAQRLEVLAQSGRLDGAPELMEELEEAFRQFVPLLEQTLAAS